MKKSLEWAALTLTSAMLSYGQTVSVNGGSISGTITDVSGAVLPNANITVQGADTGFSKQLTSDSAGFYSIGPLNPGNYKVIVAVPGFQTLAVTTVIRVGTVTSGSFKLNVGQSSETVEVNAGAIQLNTEQAGVSDVLTSQQIESLPINGRNFLDVAQIEPGVILQSGGSFDPTKAGYSALSVSGVSGRTTRILLDGQDITDETVGTTIFNVAEGAIGEFQLNRSTQDVSGDVTSTGQVLVTTKTGTNALHGELFYNFQDARSLFATEFGTQPPFQRNQFGGALGGPILKDKLFFFGNAERIKQDAAQPAGVSSIFPQYQGLNVPSPYRETYSTIRLDYSGPFGGHYFARANYNVNAIAGNFGEQFETYANRDNTPGIAGGADFQFGRFTHSFRGSYEKFHNLISDTSANAAVNLLPGIAFQNVSGVSPRLSSGPNVDAPQGTYQSDKQARYDGSWTKGAHTVRFGYSINHILGGGFANFFGLGPRLRENSATLLTNCGNVAGAAPCPADPLNGYHASSVAIGNNLGFFTENPGFGLSGGGVHDWREGAYLADSWKATPRLTISAGVRWSVDTDRANQDVADIPCSALNISQYGAAGAGDIPCSGSTSLLGQFGSQFAGPVRQPYANFAPQLGLAYALPDQKTVLRAGIGIFYEGDVFNNTTNARGNLLPAGPFFVEASGGSVCGPGKFTNPDGSITNSASVNGVSLTINQICAAPIATSAPYVLALSQGFQAASAKNPTSPNPGFFGNTLNARGLYGAPYKTPYSEQWNFGLQRELFRGGVLSADYVHNSTLKIAQTQDVNHIGAARYLNTAAAQNAIAATLAPNPAAKYAGYPMCPQGYGAASINCAIANGATINTFAAQGLDSGDAYLGGSAPANQGLTVATGAAFPGANAKLGSGAFLLPIGRSGYDALQIVFREQKSRPVPGIERSNLQISYNLSRVVSSSAGGSDQFFSNNSWDNDNPNQYIGRATLDRKHQISFGGSFLLKYGPEIGVIGHFYSALPTTLTLDNTANPNGNIFQSDLTGDGTTGDLAPGTLPGDYMHRVKPSNIGQYITNFNQTYAGNITPAGQALISAGLLTTAQLKALNGVVQTLPTLPQAIGPANPMFRQVDATFGYPVRLGHYVHTLGDSILLEPRIAFYNVGNFSNFGNDGGNPSVAPFAGNLGSAGAGSVNGPNDFATVNSYRVTRQSGTYDQGAPRSVEYQLRLSF